MKRIFVVMRHAGVDTDAILQAIKSLNFAQYAGKSLKLIVSAESEVAPTAIGMEEALGIKAEYTSYLNKGATSGSLEKVFALSDKKPCEVTILIARMETCTELFSVCRSYYNLASSPHKDLKIGGSDFIRISVKKIAAKENELLAEVFDSK